MDALGHSPCRICGYDLFGREEGSRCPECGARVIRSNETAAARGRIRRGDVIAGALTLGAVLTFVILQRLGYEDSAIVVLVSLWVLVALVGLVFSVLKKLSFGSRSPRRKE